MNKVLSAKVASMCLVTIMASLSSTAMADSHYPKNPILRPITLNASDFSAFGAIGYKKKVDGDESAFILPALSYGVTDNFTIGLGGLTYRFWENNGLELALSASGRGSFESKVIGDSKGYFAAVSGKKVIHDNLAFTFALGYVHWDEEKLENRREIDYSVGLMFNIAPKWTVSINYTLRDLHDFDQSSANEFSSDISYALRDDIDVGLFAHYADFDERVNNTVVHNSLETASGLFAKWRF